MVTNKCFQIMSRLLMRLVPIGLSGALVSIFVNIQSLLESQPKYIP